MILFAGDMIGSGNYSSSRAWASQSSWSNGNNDGDRPAPANFPAGTGSLYVLQLLPEQDPAGDARTFEAVMQAEDEMGDAGRVARMDAGQIDVHPHQDIFFR